MAEVYPQAGGEEEREGQLPFFSTWCSLYKRPTSLSPGARTCCALRFGSELVRMAGRKCSYCGNNGHNSRTCGGGGGRGAGAAGGLRLFGVHLRAAAASPMKKSFSVDCLSSAAAVFPPSAPGYSSPSTSSSSSSSSSSSLVSVEEAAADKAAANGYLSDGLLGRTHERKKGVPWSEEEHRAFLAGMEKLGKGDWRGISRSFVTTRTPTQVASHAQKYFLRQNSLHKKRRSSLFDVVGSCEHPVQQDADPSASSELQHSQGEHRRLQIDLNTDDQQETQLPSCLPLMPCCPGVLLSDGADATPLQPRNSVKPAQLAPPGLPGLELTISSPAMDRSATSPGGGFFAKGVTVT